MYQIQTKKDLRLDTKYPNVSITFSTFFFLSYFLFTLSRTDLELVPLLKRGL